MIVSDIICDLGSRAYSCDYYKEGSVLPSSSYPIKDCVKYMVTDTRSKLVFIVNKPKDKRIKNNWLNFKYNVEKATEYNIKFRLDYKSNFDLDLISVSAFRIKPSNPKETGCNVKTLLNLCNSREDFTDYLIEFSYAENGSPTLKSYGYFKNNSNDRFICRDRTAWLIIPRRIFLESRSPLIEELNIDDEGSFYIPNINFLKI